MTIPGGLRCAAAAAIRGDQRYGTAAPAPCWLLVEHDNAWGRDAVRDSGLPPEVAHRLAAHAAEHKARLLLIRRPGRRQRHGGPRRWAFADSRPGRECIGWGRYRDPADLLDADLRAVTVGDRASNVPDPAGLPPLGRPAYLVCTHGRHDACCAIRGRPVAAALAAIRPVETWECSHVGGDRFAANLVVLPHGLYYGQVTPSTAVEVVQRHETGSVLPHWLRGRSSLSSVEQAAQHYARVATGEAGLDALHPVGIEPLGPAAWRVRLAHPDGPLAVTLTADRDVPLARLTCQSGYPERARAFRLVGVDGPGSGTAGAGHAVGAM